MKIFYKIFFFFLILTFLSCTTKKIITAKYNSNIIVEKTQIKTYIDIKYKSYNYLANSINELQKFNWDNFIDISKIVNKKTNNLPKGGILIINISSHKRRLAKTENLIYIIEINEDYFRIKGHQKEPKLKQRKIFKNKTWTNTDTIELFIDKNISNIPFKLIIIDKENYKKNIYTIN